MSGESEWDVSRPPFLDPTVKTYNQKKLPSKDGGCFWTWPWSKRPGMFAVEDRYRERDGGDLHDAHNIWLGGCYGPPAPSWLEPT
jgi:hypothetical protein